MCSGKTVLCLVLFAAVAVVTVTCDVGKFSSCCTQVSTVKPRLQLVNFVLQELDLPCVEAVMFIAHNGRILCSKPNIPWVNQKIKQIQESKEKGKTV